MHACHLIHSLGPGGAENVLVDLAHVCEDAGFRMSVVALMDASGARNVAELRRLGVVVRSLGLTSRWDLRAFVKAVRVVRELAPDVVHTHLKHADLVGAMVARRLELPWISTLHVIETPTDAMGWAKRRVAGEVRLRLSSRTVTVSEAQRSWYLDNFVADPARVVTVHNGVLAGRTLDESERRDLRRSLQVPDDSIVALVVAVMRPGKGLDDVLHAVALLPQDSPLVLLLAGDGPERARLQEAALADPRVAGRVRFLGYRSDVPSLMEASDLVVHPSHADALPTAVIQAMAAARPLVATDVGGIPELVNAQSAALVPPRQPSRLAQEMEALARDSRRRKLMGTEGKRRFEEKLAAKTWARRLAALYHDVLNDADQGVERG